MFRIMLFCYVLSMAATRNVEKTLIRRKSEAHPNRMLRDPYNVQEAFTPALSHHTSLHTDTKWLINTDRSYDKR